MKIRRKTNEQIIKEAKEDKAGGLCFLFFWFATIGCLGIAKSKEDIYEFILMGVFCIICFGMMITHIISLKINKIELEIRKCQGK